MKSRDIEPQSPAELDALIALKREARLRALRKTARGGEWASPRVMMLLDALGLAFAYVVCERAGTMLPLGFAIVLGFVQLHDALDARINALVELLDVKRPLLPGGEAPSSADSHAQS